MERLNEKCSYINHAYVSRNEQLYALELLEKMRNQADIYRKEVDEVLDENKVIDSLKNPKKYYDILLYLIIYENKLTEKYKNDIVFKALDNQTEKYFNPILHILMMETELNDEIVKKIIDITNQEYVDKNHSVLGNKPFDYRYHILKRHEISLELKKEILERYEFDDSYGEDEEIQIHYDVEFELRNRDKKNSTIENDKNLSDEIRAYQLIKKRKYQINE
ncbi:MAG TPA: hypothetical protein PLV83_02555 [Bacilli bacterium]|nr:hypothetical protein [Bacilli bacterium]